MNRDNHDDLDDLERKIAAQLFRPIPESWAADMLNAAPAPPPSLPAEQTAPHHSSTPVPLPTLRRVAPLWAALAASWVVILTLNHLATAPRERALFVEPSSSTLFTVWIEQNRLGIEHLLEPEPLPPADRPSRPSRRESRILSAPTTA